MEGEGRELALLNQSGAFQPNLFWPLHAAPSHAWRSRWKHIIAHGLEWKASDGHYKDTNAESHTEQDEPREAAWPG